MDQKILVTAGHELIRLLRERNINIKAALWFYNTDIDAWRLWLVPDVSIKDKHSFYRNISEILSGHKELTLCIEVSDTEMITEKHPAIKALQGMFKVTDRSSITIDNSMLNGFYLPKAIVIEYDI
ncbi:hypothetical protein [Methylobacterium sp. Leaf102]|uniref:hypothetical protein n=1 Tax=Methylobacterium sp. Leaf102 TaxID=1736253 RepID=UPI0012E7F84D|nr:hypothetical protein [Methylobacterium sp. Leaf102]